MYDTLQMDNLNRSNIIVAPFFSAVARPCLWTFTSLFRCGYTF